MPAIVSAMAAGTVSQEQAGAIVGVLKKLPDTLSTEQVQLAEKTMIGLAADHGPKGLRSLAGYLLVVIAPKIAEATEAAQLEAQEREARKTQFLRLRDDGDGCVTITGKLPAADGDASRAVVDAIAKSPQAESDASTDGPSRTEPAPSFEARRAQALITLVHSYAAGGDAPQHGGDRPRVVVLIDYDHLVRGVAGATLMWSDTRISASEARRLACDADILPAVLARTPTSWMSVGRPGCSPATSGKPSPSGTAAVSSPGATVNHVTATPTTSCPGLSAARPASTTAPSWVPSIIGWSNPIRTLFGPPSTNAGTYA